MTPTHTVFVRWYYSPEKLLITWYKNTSSTNHCDLQHFILCIVTANNARHIYHAFYLFQGAILGVWLATTKVRTNKSTCNVNQYKYAFLMMNIIVLPAYVRNKGKKISFVGESGFNFVYCARRDLLWCRVLTELLLPYIDQRQSKLIMVDIERFPKVT